MNVSLQEAVNVLDERKIAAFDDGAVFSPVSKVPMLAVGLDVDVDELRELSEEIGSILLRVVLRDDIPLGRMLAGAWTDGVLTGLLLADLRTKEAA